ARSDDRARGAGPDAAPLAGDAPGRRDRGDPRDGARPGRRVAPGGDGHVRHRRDRAMTSPLRALRAAFIFLTRVPVGGFPFEPAEWRWAASWFPFVGAAVGAATAGVFVALRGMGSLAAALLAIGASLLLTGAFHEDGLADTSDALGGATDRAKIFLILKDSRVGSFGASALILSLAGRAALLAQLHAHPLQALVLTGSIARAAAVWQMATLP